MLKLVFNGVQRNLSLRLRSLLLYSTTSSSSDEPSHFMVDYLVDSLGFSREEAVAASKKVSRLKSPEIPNSVIDLFKKFGLTQPQIKRITTYNPYLFSSRNVNKTLAPKIRAFQDLGFSGAELGNMLASNPSILSRRLEGHIKPLVEILRSILGSDENVVKAINRSYMLVSANVPKRILGNVLLFRSFGLSDERIRMLVLNNPGNLITEPRMLEVSLRYVEEKLGISRKSLMFIHGVHALCSISKPALELKFNIFKSYGWTQEDIMTMARILPHCLKLSEAKIRKGLDYFMKELGHEPGYICSRPKLLMYSMENRVLPRKAICEALNEKKLVKGNRELYSVLAITEDRFLKKYVFPFKSELPELCEAYINKSFLLSKAIVDLTAADQALEPLDKEMEDVVDLTRDFMDGNCPGENRNEHPDLATQDKMDGNSPEENKNKHSVRALDANDSVHIVNGSLDSSSFAV